MRFSVDAFWAVFAFAVGFMLAREPWRRRWCDPRDHKDAPVKWGVRGEALICCYCQRPRRGTADFWPQSRRRR